MAEHVPTVVELASMGEEYAVAVEWTNDGTEKSPRWRATKWRVLDAGHALMGAALRANGREARAALESS